MAPPTSIVNPSAKTTKKGMKKSQCSSNVIIAVGRRAQKASLLGRRSSCQLIAKSSGNGRRGAESLAHADFCISALREEKRNKSQSAEEEANALLLHVTFKIKKEEPGQQEGGAVVMVTSVPSSYRP